MHLTRKVALFIFILILCVASCSKKEDKKESASEKKTAEDTINEEEIDLLLVESDRFKVYASEAFEYIKQTSMAEHKKQGRKDYEAIVEEVIDNLVLLYSVYDDAIKEGFSNSDYEQVTRKYFIGKAKRPLINEKIKEEVEKRVSISKADEKELEKKLPKDFTQIVMRQIVLGTKEEAEKVLKMAKNGEDFIDLVIKYSEGPTASLRNGLTDPYFMGSDLFSDPEDEKMVFALNEGEVCEKILKSPLGYIVCKLETKRVISDEEINKLKESYKDNATQRELSKRMKEIYEQYYDRSVIDKGAIFSYLERIKNGEEQEDAQIASFDNLKVMMSHVTGGVIDVSSDYFKKKNIHSLTGVYFIQAKKFMTTLVLSDYFPDIEIPVVVQRSMNPEIKGRVVDDYLDRHKYKDVTVNEEEIRQAYDDNFDRFSRDEKYYVNLILLDTKEEADVALKMLNDGKEFQKVAKELSKDETTGKRGGSLGWITRKNTSVPPKIMNIIFTSEVNKIIGPIEDEAGHFLILKMTDYLAEYIAEYEEMKEVAKDLAIGRKINELKRDYFNKLKEEIEVKRYEENIAKVVDEFKKRKKNKAGNIPGH